MSIALSLSSPEDIARSVGRPDYRRDDKVAIAIDRGSCHLFKADGTAVQRAMRHPLADIKDPTAHAAA